LVGLETGLRSLDELMMGLQKGSLYVMAGRPGMGKTAVSMTIAENIADRYQDGAVLVFNLEMSKEQLALRALASVAEVSLKDLQKGSDDHGQNWTKLNNGLGKSMERKMFTDVRATVSIAQIRAKLQAEARTLVCDDPLLAQSNRYYPTTHHFTLPGQSDTFEATVAKNSCTEDAK